MNSLIGVPDDIVAKLHLLYRSSVVGRRLGPKELLSTIKPLKKFKDNPLITNRNVEILQAYLKSMGIQIEFFGNEIEVKLDTGKIYSEYVGNKLVIGTKTDIEDEKLRQEVDYKFENEIIIVGSTEEINELKEKEFVRLKRKQDPIKVIAKTKKKKKKKKNKMITVDVKEE